MSSAQQTASPTTNNTSTAASKVPMLPAISSHHHRSHNNDLAGGSSIASTLLPTITGSSGDPLPLPARLDATSRDLCLESARVKGDKQGQKILELGWNPHTARSTIFSGYAVSTLWERPDGTHDPNDDLIFDGSIRNSDAWKLRGGDYYHSGASAAATGKNGGGGDATASHLEGVVPRYLQPKPPRGDAANASPEHKRNPATYGSPPRVAYLAKPGPNHHAYHSPHHDKSDSNDDQQRRNATLVTVDEDKKRQRVAAARRAKKGQQIIRDAKSSSAATLVQALMRWQSSLNMVELVKKHGAAVTIQCAYRSAQAKREAKRRQQQKWQQRKAEYERELSSLEVLFASADDAADLFAQSQYSNGGGPPTPTDHPFDTDPVLINILKEINFGIQMASDQKWQSLFNQLRERANAIAEERRKKRLESKSKKQVAQKKDGPGSYDIGVLVEDEEYGKLLDELGRALEDGEEAHQARVDAIRELLKKRAAQLAKLKAADQARLATALRQKEADLLKRRSAIAERRDRAKSLAHERVALMNSKQARLDLALKRMAGAGGAASAVGGTRPHSTASGISGDDSAAGGEALDKQYTADELQRLRAQFDQVDSDGSGDVSREEFVAFYPLVCSFDVDRKWCMDLFDELDVDGGGSLTFEEFVNVFALVQRREEAMRNPGESARLEKIQRQLRQRAEAIAKVRAEEQAIKARILRERQEEIERNKQRATDAKTIRSFNKGKPSTTSSPAAAAASPNASPRSGSLAPQAAAQKPPGSPASSRTPRETKIKIEEDNINLQPIAPLAEETDTSTTNDAADRSTSIRRTSDPNEEEGTAQTDSSSVKGNGSAEQGSASAVKKEGTAASEKKKPSGAPTKNPSTAATRTASTSRTKNGA